MDYGFSNKLPKNDKRLKRYARQRKKRGFDDTETWNLYVTITNFIVPRLKRFRKTTISHPPNLTMEEWKDILKQMTRGFEEVLKSDEEDCDHEKTMLALELFSKWYFHLWS